MTLREVLGRLRAWRRRDELDRGLAADLDAHVELLARDLEQAGLSSDDARVAARRHVGNLTNLRERSREYWGFPAIDVLLQDLRYAIRGLGRAPGFTATVVITLALGIGANAAMFGVIDRLMFRPFPYLREPGVVHRVYLMTTYRGRETSSITFPYRRYQDLEAARGTIAATAAQSEWRFAVGSGDASRIRKVAGVSASYFDFFDAAPAHGRYFSAVEDTPPRGALVAVLSHAYWQSEFAGQEVLGRQLKIGVLDYTIIGVVPPRFVGAAGGVPPDVWIPLTAVPATLGQWSPGSYLDDYSWDWIQVLVRRAPGADAQAVSAELTGAYIRSRAAARALNPRVQPDSLARPRALAGPVKVAAGPDAGLESRVLLWVTGVAAIVLLIACANVANLMLARVIRRRREITVRLALGVRRRRLVAQFLTEAMLLALVGCAAGLLVAQASGVAIRQLLLPEGSAFNLAEDWRTIGFALACATTAALLTALGPVLLTARADFATALKTGARDGTGQRSRLQEGLLVLQAALSVLLLVGAGLFVRSLDKARSVPLGYDARPVLEVITDYRGYEMDSVTRAATQQRLLESARALPGVASAAFVNSRVFGTNTASLRVDRIDSVEALGRFNFQMASPEYFDVMQIRVLRGRGLTESDGVGAPWVAVVSEAMARALWPGRDAIGQCLFVELERAPTKRCTRVVGIADNTAQQDLADDPRFMYYLPAAQRAPWGLSTVLIRMRDRDAARHVEGVRRALTRAMPGDGFVVVRPLQEVVDGQTRSWRLGATLFVGFGALALLVAVVGLYGVISYSVAQRMHELGVRIALGARSADVMRLVVLTGLRLAIAGVAAGLSAAWLGARWVEPLLFRQPATDPLTYGVVGVAMLLAALAASAMPAFRAARADPNSALRAE